MLVEVAGLAHRSDQLARLGVAHELPFDQRRATELLSVPFLEEGQHLARVPRAVPSPPRDRGDARRCVLEPAQKKASEAMRATPRASARPSRGQREVAADALDERVEPSSRPAVGAAHPRQHLLHELLVERDLPVAPTSPAAIT